MRTVGERNASWPGGKTRPGSRLLTRVMCDGGIPCPLTLSWPSRLMNASCKGRNGDGDGNDARTKVVLAIPAEERRMIATMNVNKSRETVLVCRK